ncbi:hypothetical protein NQZ68_011997 [Dissostichus eleginoides]|nr:hypothetical protein NQZ68_011997 [Dissostichus eleginoides]
MDTETDRNSLSCSEEPHSAGAAGLSLSLRLLWKFPRCSLRVLMVQVKSPEVFIIRGPGALDAAHRGSNCSDGKV